MERLIREYIDAGWYLIPLKPGKKVPLEGQGVDHASNDTNRMLDYLRRYPDMNLGLALRESGLLAVDVDERSGGHETLRNLERQQKCMPETAMSETAQNGLHFLFQRPDDEIKNSNGKLPGIDIKTSGGYIVLPPSRLMNTEKHRAGGYRWAHKANIARLPRWLIDMLRVKDENWMDVKRKIDPRYRVRGKINGTPEAAFAGRVRAIANAPDYNRNNWLNKCAYFAFQDLKAGQLNLSEHEMRSEMYRAARAAGLDHEESEKTIQSAYSKVMENQSAT